MTGKKVLVIGGTRFFGVYTVKELIEKGYQVTIATRGNTKDFFGESVERIVFDRMNQESIQNAFVGKQYDVVIDKLAYCSNDVKKLLSVLHCSRYIQMSSTAVYEPLHINTKEDEWDPKSGALRWCDRQDASYDEVKRQAERAIYQEFSNFPAVSVRYPFVIGKDDYTRRLFFYVEHVVKQIPMYIDNLTAQMSFIKSDEAGRFIAALADMSFEGTINGASKETISMEQIIRYVEEKTDKKAIFDKTSEAAPYNGTKEYSVNTKKAEQLGFSFSHLSDWIYELLDEYIIEALKS